MPIGFLTDTSPQGGGTFTSGSTFYPTVNQQKLDTTSNTLKTFIDTKQNTLTGSTTLLGVGSSITALNYNNITLNLPSTFPSDWSTLANKPSTFPSDYNTQANKPTYYPCDLSSYYTKTSTDTLLNAKQPLIIATCNLVGNGSAITAVNYNNLTNAPNLSVYATISSLSSYQLLLTSTTTLSGIGSNLTLINYNTLSNLPNLSGYATTGSLSSYQLLLTSTTTLSGVGSNLTLINYNTLSNLPNLSGYATTSSLSGYQLLLTATTTLSGIGSNLTLINYNTLSNLPNLAQYLTASTTGLTNYTTTSALTTILSNYSSTANTTTLISSALVPYSTTTAMNSAISTALTPYLTTATAGTTYQPKINTYSLSPSGTVSFNSGTLTFDLSAYQTSASLGTTYLALAGGTMTGNLTLSTGVLTVSSTTTYSYFGGLRIAGWDGNTLYNGTNQLGITALNNVSIQTGTTLANYATRLFINTSGNVGIGTTTNLTGAIFNVYGNSLFNGSIGIGTTINTTYGIQIIPTTFTAQLRLEGGTGIKALSIGGTGSLSVDASGVASGRFVILDNGNVGIGNPSPSTPLWVGRPDVASTGSIVISQNTNGGNRNFKIGYDTSFNFCFGDYGNANGTNTFVSQFSIAYAAPANSLIIAANGNVGIGQNLAVGSALSVNGNIGNPNWYFTNQNDYCRLYAYGTTNYFKFAASDLYSQYTLSVGTTSSFGGNMNLSGNLSGGYNVSKKSILSITPTYVSAGVGSYYTFNIDVTQYISGCPGPYSTMYVFKATLFTNTGDWGDTGNNVETMSYDCYISGYAGGKSRFYQIYNSSTLSYLFYPGSGTKIYYWGGATGGGGGTKILILENIAYY